MPGDTNVAYLRYLDARAKKCEENSTESRWTSGKSDEIRANLMRIFEIVAMCTWRD